MRVMSSTMRQEPEEAERQFVEEGEGEGEGQGGEQGWVSGETGQAAPVPVGLA